jgi:hypothetical protein
MRLIGAGSLVYLLAVASSWFGLHLSAARKADLVEYLKSL